MSRLDPSLPSVSFRVKVGFDSESDEDAARLFGHATSATTTKHCRAKPDVVKPLNRVKNAELDNASAKA